MWLIFTANMRKHFVGIESKLIHKLFTCEILSILVLYNLLFVTQIPSILSFTVRVWSGIHLCGDPQWFRNLNYIIFSIHLNIPEWIHDSPNNVQWRSLFRILSSMPTTWRGHINRNNTIHSIGPTGCTGSSCQVLWLSCFTCDVTYSSPTCMYAIV